MSPLLAGDHFHERPRISLSAITDISKGCDCSMLHDNNKVVSNIIVNSWVNVLIKHPILDNVIVITASKNIDQITRHGSRHSPTKF